MSEYQNRAVELLIASVGEATVVDHVARRQQFMRQAFKLFRAMDGSSEEASRIVLADRSRPASDIGSNVGDVMIELAGIAYAHDIDMMQAAYNTLEQVVRKK